MIWTQNEAKLAHTFYAPVDTSFIEVGSKEIYAVRTTNVISPVPIYILNTRAVRLLNDGSDPEMALNVFLILKWNAVRINKSKVRNGGLEICA